MVPDHKSKVTRYGTLTRIQFIVGTKTGFRLEYHNVTFGTAIILKHQRVVWYSAYFDTSNRLGVVHSVSDRQTGGIALDARKKRN